MLLNPFAYFRKKREKKEFHEYGSRVDTFNLSGSGEVQFAQWLHPSSQPVILDEGLVSFYRQFIHPGDFAIDIGAHTGDTTVPMALAAEKNGPVLALEPNKYVYAILQQNSRLNIEKTNIIPLCIAATKDDGNFVFNYSDASFCNGGFLTERTAGDRHHKYTLEIQGRNLDKLLRENYAEQLPQLSFLKVDAEGYDKEIIKNLSGIIKEFQPFVLSECNHYLVQAEREELFDIMSEGGNKLYVVGNDPERPADLRSVSTVPLQKKDMMFQRHFDLLAVPPHRSL